MDYMYMYVFVCICVSAIEGAQQARARNYLALQFDMLLTVFRPENSVRQRVWVLSKQTVRCAKWSKWSLKRMKLPW